MIVIEQIELTIQEEKQQSAAGGKKSTYFGTLQICDELEHDTKRFNELRSRVR